MKNTLASWPLPFQSPLLPQVSDIAAPGRFALLEQALQHARFITQWHCHKRRDITRSKALSLAIDACKCAGLELAGSGVFDKGETVEDRGWALYHLLSVVVGSHTASYRWPPRCGFANVTRWVARGLTLAEAVKAEQRRTTAGDSLARREPGWCVTMDRRDRLERIRWDILVGKGIHYGLDLMEWRATYDLEYLASPSAVATVAA